MDTLILIYTKRPLNIGSLAIRWALPRTRFHLARMSHVIIADSGSYIEATFGGVRRIPDLSEYTIVEEVAYQVPDREKGLVWLREQIGKPYDYNGAFGLALAPNRRWDEDDKWECFELGAATLLMCGRKDFREDAGHITGEMMLALNPVMRG